MDVNQGGTRNIVVLGPRASSIEHMINRTHSDECYAQSLSIDLSRIPLDLRSIGELKGGLFSRIAAGSVHGIVLSFDNIPEGERVERTKQVISAIRAVETVLVNSINTVAAIPSTVGRPPRISIAVPDDPVYRDLGLFMLDNGVSKIKCLGEQDCKREDLIRGLFPRFALGAAV